VKQGPHLKCTVEISSAHSAFEVKTLLAEDSSNEKGWLNVCVCVCDVFDYSSQLQSTSDATLVRPLYVLEALDDLALNVEVKADLEHHVFFQHDGLFLQFTRRHCKRTSYHS